jgi:hypothetical protein
LAVVIALCWATPAHAYPWMIRHGYGKCASCHTDPMGGELLTGFGRVISDTTLSTRWDGSKDPTTKAELFFGVPEPRDLSVGGSVRYMDALYTLPTQGSGGTFTTFPMQIDAYGQLRLWQRLRIAGSLGIGDVEAGSIYSRAAQITQNNGDHDVNLLSRSHWIGYDVTDHILVRAGRINLPFGLRIPEHVMWARATTVTDRESDQQGGVAASYSGGRWRGEVMAIAGNYQISPDKFRARGYSLYGEYLLNEHNAIGLSSLVTHAQEDRLNLSLNAWRQAHGLTGRFGPIPKLAILAEADLLIQSFASAGYVGMVQGDYEIIQGLHGMLTGEIQDPGKMAGLATKPGNGEPQLGAWLSVNWFFFTHFDARVDFVLRQQASSFLASQIHYYF